ncbi:CcdB family protein [Alkalimonas sp. MEB108]|uniref:Toxin CcdB n=1 Tax=Alkalimonas cellulosilytica TaxID=3058395 RepID=A0ABU7J410_9GAMM|nr:CcdB family protein [Alkalimonas sp. MEB108]MEE2000772.1 CcdB family protein [Alkalimonas sp. MEB108]
MAQFFAYKNANPKTRQQYPYLLDIQSDLLSELKTTVVIPLSPAEIAAPMSLTRLNPSCTLDGKVFIVRTQDIAGIDRSQLRGQAYDLTAYRSEVMAAVDFILSGI